VISTTKVRVHKDYTKGNVSYGPAVAEKNVPLSFAFSQYTATETTEKYLERSVNDMFPDDGISTYSALYSILSTLKPRIGIQQKINSGKDFYYPRRFFTSIPCGEIGIIDAGYLLTANRDGTKGYYSQVTDRPYSMGYYRSDIQKQEFEQNIRAIESINGVISIFMKSKTKGMALNVSTDVGNSELGESIKKLQQAYMISENVGIICFGSIAYKGSNLIIAITNEFAVRYFDGTKWDTTDLSVGFVKSLISKLDPYYPIVASYSQEGGYKIWGRIWKKA
jgi:hypothetical protein